MFDETRGVTLNYFQLGAVLGRVWVPSGGVALQEQFKRDIWIQ